MATPVEVPKLGNTVEECIIAKWRKQKGDSVAEGDVVAEIETDKATFEVPAPVAGTLLATFFEEGALVPVYTNMFVIGEPGEDAEPFRPGGNGLQAGPEPVRSADQPVAPSSAPVSQGAGNASFSPRARRFAEERDFHPASIAGSGPGGRVLEEDVRHAYFSSPRVSSAARRQMADRDLEAREGSGAAGRILAADLAPRTAKISTIRERIARRMRESLAGTAQYTLSSSADARGLLLLRARVKASTGVPDININDMVAFCTVQALLQVPDLNAEFIDGRIQKHVEVNLGFAVDTNRGLMVPVVRGADKLSIGDLALRMKDLTARATGGAISPDDLSGATFTISNLGNLGIESFTPVLNPPQVGILGVCAIQLKPVRRDGRVEFIDSIGLSLTCDHQVIDGAPGARFLKVVREKIENVESLCTICS
jgi:pyruvate dehydrogenase E2 component (dihydrolipoamide acetyltransferase)